jgi:hypothetical protein
VRRGAAATAIAWKDSWAGLSTPAQENSTMRAAAVQRDYSSPVSLGEPQVVFPVVFESAGCLLGVYSNGRGSSAAVVGHFGKQDPAREPGT